MADDYKYFRIPKFVEKKYTPIDRFPSVSERISDDVEIMYAAETLDEFAASIGAMACRVADNGLDISCEVPAERWPLLKDALKAFSYTKYLPVNNHGFSSGRECYARVKYITVNPAGENVEVYIALDPKDTMEGKPCSNIPRRTW
ncbi:MAG: hypothetical protein GXO43_01255 [Crenarchaeota archaeon]|nr:hypothetical protein [Thermoproteota archaeon]